MTELSKIKRTINHALMNANAYEVMNRCKTKEDLVDFVISATANITGAETIAKCNELIYILKNKPTFASSMKYLSDFILAGEGLRVI